MSNSFADILSQLPNDWTVQERDAVSGLLEEYEASLNDYRAAGDRVARARRNLVRLLGRCRNEDCCLEFCGPATRDKCLYMLVHRRIAAEITTRSHRPEPDGESCVASESPQGPSH
jgi:hypothetical protein